MTTTPALRQPDLDALAASLSGRLLRARRCGLRRRPPRPQRADRSPTGADRALPERGRRGRGGALRPRWGARDLRPGRRSQRGRARGRGRRRDDRPGRDEGDPGRPGCPNGTRRGRRDLGGAQCRGRGARPGGHRRRHLHDGDRRAHARRRARLAHAEVRAGLGQRARDRARDRRRRGRRGHGRIGPGPVLGAAWRRRQLRGGHHLHLPAAPAGHGDGRADRAPDRRGPGVAALLSRGRGGRLGRPGGLRRAWSTPRTARGSSWRRS